jgi:hypothetical protein
MESLSHQLSYSEMVLDKSGSIVGRDEKESQRKQLGYCLSCQDDPVLLIEINRSRMNPMWSTKKPRTADGECLNGKCLRCHPTLASRRSTRLAGRQALISIPSLRSVCSSESQCSSGSNEGDGFSRSNHSSQSLRSAESAPAFRNPNRPPLRTAHSSDGFERLSAGPRRTISNARNGTSIRSTPSRAFSDNRALRSLSIERAPVPPHEPQARNIATLSAVSQVSGPAALSLVATPNMTAVQPSQLYRAPLARCNSDMPDVVAGTSQRRRSLEFSRDSEEDVVLTAECRRVESIELAPSAPEGTKLDVMDNVPQSVNFKDVYDEEKTCEGEADPFSESFALMTPSPSLSRSSRGATSFEINEEDRIVKELKELIGSVGGDENVGIVTEILGSSLDVNQTHEKVQLYCLNVMEKVFQGVATDSSALVSKIVRAMKTFTTAIEMQKHGCRVICTLAATLDNCVALDQGGACNSVTEALSKHIGDAALVEDAIAALRALSISNDAKRSLEQLGVSQRVAEAMQCNLTFAGIQRDGCALLSNMAVDGEKRKVFAVDFNVVEAVVAALKAHSSEISVVQSASFALKNFLYEESNWRTLRKVDCVFGVLEHIASHSEDCSYVLEQIQLSRAEDDSLEEVAYESLLALTEACGDQPGVVDDVIGITQEFNWSVKMTAACMEALVSLAGRSKQHRQAIESSSTFSDISGIVERNGGDLRVQQAVRSLVDILKSDDLDMYTSESSFTSYPETAVDDAAL